MNHHQSITASQPTELAPLTAAALQHLETLGYHPETQRKYQQTWDALRQYALDVMHTDHFSVAVAEGFRRSIGISPDTPEHTLPYTLRYCVRAVRVLIEFAQHGCFHRWRSHSRQQPLPSALQEIQQAYEEACRREGIRERTIDTRRDMLRRLGEFMVSRGMANFTDLTAAILSDFIVSQSRYNANTVCLTVRNLRLFLRHLHQYGHHPVDLSTTLPRVPGRFRDLLPTTMTTEDVARLLAAVDRDSPLGKRDYAILLLAARLGMRVSDICTLRLEHIDWDAGRIQKPQSKTGQLLDLPLLEEVGWALIDYLQHGRPQRADREVFLTHEAPIHPFASGSSGLFTVMERYRRRAGIPAPPDARRGMHALRHAVASHLLEQGTPFSVISGVLGHIDADTTRVYTKIDIERLRECALESPEVEHA